MFSISHSAHAPRYIQMRQSFNHAAPAFFSSSIAARTASVHTRCVPVAGYINLVRLHLLQQLLDDLHIRLANGVLLDAPRLVERKVEEMHMVQRDAVIRACRACLSPTYQPLYGQDVTRVDVAFLLLKQELLDVGIHLADGLVLILIKKLVETVDEVHEAYHLLIAYGNIARSLVCHMHVVTLLHQTADGTRPWISHRHRDAERRRPHAWGTAWHAPDGRCHPHWACRRASR